MGKERNRVNPDRQRQRYSREFKLEAVRQLELGQKPAAQLALELGIRRGLLYRWQKDLQGKGDEAFRGQGRKPREQQSEVQRLKSELHHSDFHTREAARAAIFNYIEIFYNRRRRHQALGYISPVQFEERQLN